MVAPYRQSFSIHLRIVYNKQYFSSLSDNQLLTFSNHETATVSSQLHQNGFAKTSRPILTQHATQRIKCQLPKLFRGEFDTGNYPDEWHWREGISRPDAAREMCNSWKSDRTIASIVLDEGLGRFIAKVMGWDSVRIAQDDLVWKPPSSLAGDDKNASEVIQKRIGTVGFHQDSAYISTQFYPYENNSVTLWIALDDADEKTGCVEYAVGSHKWRPILHQRDAEESTAGANEISSFHSSDESSYRNGLAVAARFAGIINPHDATESAPVKEGYAILHHQDVWHGSGPNLSNTRHRRALVAHYIRGDVTFRESNEKQCGPFGNATYIYGRYKRYKSVELDESFFPIIYGDTRTVWIDGFVGVRT
jgi:phytanoyl-CoA hydroxylase